MTKKDPSKSPAILLRVEENKVQAHRKVCDAIELKKVAYSASITKGARRIGGAVYRELRDRAASNLWEARELHLGHTRRVWNRNRPKYSWDKFIFDLVETAQTPDLK